MAVLFRSVATATVTASTSLVITNNRDTADATITAPAGWTSLGSQGMINGEGFTGLGQAFHRRAGGSEGANYTWTINGTDNVAVGAISCYQNVSSSSGPVDTSAFAAFDNTSAPVASSVTTTMPRDMLVVLTALIEQVTSTPPVSMTERADFSGTTGLVNSAVNVADELLSATGATGTRTFSTSGVTDCGVWTVALLQGAVTRGYGMVSG